MIVKMHVAPRLKIQIIKAMKGDGYDLRVGDIYDGLSIHHKPIDGIRWYISKDNFILIPLDHFRMIARY